MELSQRDLFTQAVVQTILDYYIFNSGGGLNGTMMQQPEPLQINATVILSTNIYSTTKTPAPQQNTKKMFYLIEQIDQKKVQKVIDQVIANSSKESVLSFKVHVKQLSENDIENMTEDHLKLVKADIVVHDDAEYRNRMLAKLSQLYYKAMNVPEAVDCIVHMRDGAYAAKFILDRIAEKQLEIALQVSFNLYEQLPS